MVRLSVGLCVVLMTSLAVAVNAGRPAFVAEWLEQQTAAAAPTSVGLANYKERDVDWGCFKEAVIANCRCVGCSAKCAGSTELPCEGEGAGLCCYTNYFESQLACCPKEEHERYAHGNQDIVTNADDVDIGSCDFTVQELPTHVEMDSTIEKGGAFSAVCNLKAGGRCGHPFCDHMVLNWEGVFYFHLALSATNPDPPAFCVETVEKKQGKSHRERLVERVKEFAEFHLKKKGESVPVKKAAAGATAEIARHSQDISSYFTGAAFTLSGPVTVSSRRYNTQYRDGFMEYSYWQPGDIDAAEYPVIKPYTYTLQLNKPSKYQAE